MTADPTRNTPTLSSPLSTAAHAGQGLRFCIVSTFYPPYNFGGDGIYAHRLANGLARLGHRVTVVHSPSAYLLATKKEPDRGYDDHPNVQVCPVRTPAGALGLLAVQQTGMPTVQARQLRTLLDHREHDVVHFNNVSLLGGPGVFRYARSPRTLKLCTLIEHWLICPMHVLWKMDERVCDKPDCLRCTLHGKRPPQLWRWTGLMRRATRSIDAFVGPSLFTMNMHASRGLRGTMVQLPLFNKEPVSAGDASRDPAVGAAIGAKPYLLFVGRLEKIKGLHTVLPLFRRRPDIGLVVAGGGNFERELHAAAAGSPNILFLGRCDHERLARLYKHAAATIVPSLCYETFGIIVAESWAARTPVIVRAQSSLKELVETCGGGLAYTPALAGAQPLMTTPDAASLEELGLEAAIDRLIREPGLRDRLAAEGRRAYETEFAETPFLRHYLATVTEMLERKRTGRPLYDGVGDGATVAGRRVIDAA